MSNKLNLVSILSVLPTYTKLSVLYPVLGSLNAAAINTAGRTIADNLDTMRRIERTSPFSIDKYNEYLNELRSRDMEAEARHEQGFDREESPNDLSKSEYVGEHDIEHDGEDGKESIRVIDSKKARLDRLDQLLILRAPLIAMFQEAVDELPQRDGESPDFSFEESLARQLAREFSLEQRAQDETDKALIESGAVTAEELAANDKQQFQADQDFKNEFKHLIIDELNSKAPLHASVEDADAAFNDLGYEFGERMVKRILPKLEEAKRNQLTRRQYDPDATVNITLIGLSINEMKKFAGPSDAEERLKKLQQVLAA